MIKKWMTAFLVMMAMAVMAAGCGQSSEQDNQTSGQGSEAPSGGTDVQDSTGTAGQTEDLLDQILKNGVIIIGTEGTYSPNSYHDENGDLVGFDVEVGRKIAEKLGVEAEFVEAGWDSLVAGMDAGRIDVIINEMEYTEERAEKYDFSQPYTYIHGALMTVTGNEEIHSFEDLDGKKAAQNMNSSWGRMAEEYGAEVVGVETVAQCIDLLLSGRADATLNVETAFSDYLRSHPDAGVEVVALTDSTSSSRVPVRKGNEKLLAAIEEALTALHESGELSELSEKYFGTDVTKQ